MRETMYLGSKAYQKQTFVIEAELLAQLELMAKQQQTTLSNLLNTILNKEIKNND